MGVIGKPHGVRGLVHLHSYSANPADLVGYGLLVDDAGQTYTFGWAGVGIARIACIINGAVHPVTDREGAARLVNTRLYIPRDRLPPLDAEEFYLADLVGLAAQDAGGARLGTVVAIHDYGAGEVIELMTPAGTQMLPFTRACIPDVDLAAGMLTVHPPTELEADERALLPAAVA